MPSIDGDSLAHYLFLLVLSGPHRIHSSQSVRSHPVHPFCRAVCADIASLTLPSRTHRPLYQTSSGQWRALSKGTPVAPGAAYSYITRTLRQTAPQIVGALRLLGTTYSPAELNEKGYAIYAEFRPEVDGWGKRAEVKCSTILALRKKVDDGGKKSGGDNGSVEADKIVKIQTTEGDEDDKEPHDTSQGTEEPSQKKSRGMTLEEYEAALDADDTFDDLDLSMVDVPGDPLPTKETDSKTRI